MTSFLTKWQRNGHKRRKWTPSQIQSPSKHNHSICVDWKWHQAWHNLLLISLSKPNPEDKSNHKKQNQESSAMLHLCQTVLRVLCAKCQHEAVNMPVFTIAMFPLEILTEFWVTRVKESLFSCTNIMQLNGIHKQQVWPILKSENHCTTAEEEGTTKWCTSKKADHRPA